MLPVGNLIFKPLSKNTWEDFETLFGERGACGGCWCMTWRLRAADYEKNKGEGNKKLFKKLVTKNKSLGVLAYSGTEIIGWCSVSPKNELTRVSLSRTLKTIDEKPVWSIVCFFINKKFRKKGVSKSLLKEAVQYAIKNGAALIESYPVIPKKKIMPDVFAFTGLYSVFKDFGFKREIVHKSGRPVMRYFIE